MANNDNVWGMNGGVNNRCEMQLRSIAKGIKSQNPLILEIGCWTGRSTVALATARKDARIVSVDWFKGSPGTAQKPYASSHDVFNIWRGNLRKRNITNVCLMYMSSFDACSLMKNHMFDMIFIDGDHRYSHVKSDIVMWKSRVKKGGIICGHDYEKHSTECPEWMMKETDRDFLPSESLHPGVIRAVSELFPKDDIIQIPGKVWLVTL